MSFHHKRLSAVLISNSLSTRLVVMVSVLLILFFSITTALLDGVFRATSRQAISDRLDIQVLALMAATEENEFMQLTPAKLLLDSRYLGPNSGLYAQVQQDGDQEVWTSPSLLGTKLHFNTKVGAGQRIEEELTMANGVRVLALNVGLSWEFVDGKSRTVVYSVAESMEQYYEQLRSFRIRLFGGFAVMSLLLIIAMAALFRNVLKPLRRIEQEIEGIEAGNLLELGSGYPRELQGVTENMNTLLRSERERMARYRNTLGNLAHSLKTPLAVLRNVLAAPECANLPSSGQLDEQIARMDDIVRYQLKRAAASAGTTLGAAPVQLRELVEPLVATLQKVYFERRVSCKFEVAPDCALLADKGDLMELLGNLFDNAFKYCHDQVRITVTPLSVPGSRRTGVLLVCEDDGPGIPPERRVLVLQRGTRLDERPIGQGIGLSVVKELTELYRGSVDIDDSDLGGARITVRLLGA